MIVATHAGSGTNTVHEIMRDCGAKLRVVGSLKEAKRTKFDRLLLLGGSDVNPSFYGQPDRHCYMIDQRRDAIEWYLARKALDARIPVMGICRGMQMLAVACGGSLHQDLQLEGIVRKSHTRGTHKIVRVDKVLKAHMPKFTHRVNSRHHQAIKRMPFGFKVIAKSPGGVIESIWTPGYLGVQWHPESMWLDNAKWGILFRWLLQGLK